MELNLRWGIDSKTISNYSIFSTGLFFLQQPETRISSMFPTEWRKNILKIDPKVIFN